MAYTSTPRPELVDLGKRIAAARDIVGLTQEQLAIRVTHKSGVTLNRNQIQQYESGQAEPPGLKLDAIAYALGIEVSELTGKRRLNPLAIALDDDGATEEDKQEAIEVAADWLARRKKKRMEWQE